MEVNTSVSIIQHFTQACNPQYSVKKENSGKIGGDVRLTKRTACVIIMTYANADHMMKKYGMIYEKSSNFT